MRPPGTAGCQPAQKATSTAKSWLSRGYLPHFHGDRVLQVITYRLADSLPKHVVAGMQIELESFPESERCHRYRQRIQHLLDAGHGSCILAKHAIAQTIEDNWHHFDGIRYHLLAWVVMPNHVHVMIQPDPGWRLDQIVHSWKSYTANRIQTILQQDSDSADVKAIWQREYFDRFIRDKAHYSNAIRYIHDNPVAAGLCSAAEHWPFSSARYAA